MSKFIKLHLVRTLNKYRELQKIRVKDIMISGDVITTTPEKTVKEVFNDMIINNISGIPVIDEYGAIIGMITLREIRKYIVTDPQISVKEVMLKNPPYTTVDEDIITAFEKMINFDKKLDQLPVINTKCDEEIFRKLEGIIYMEDIITLLYENIIKELKTLVSLYNGQNKNNLGYITP